MLTKPQWLQRLSLPSKRIELTLFSTLAVLSIHVTEAQAVIIRIQPIQPPGTPISISGGSGQGLPGQGDVGDLEGQTLIVNDFSVQTRENLPESVVGDGNLFDVVRAAADVWETGISDDFDLTLNIGWASFSGNGKTKIPFSKKHFDTPIDGLLALHVINQSTGSPEVGDFRETEGTILFNSDTLKFNLNDPDQASDANLFLDSTPRVNEEFSGPFEASLDLGGSQPVNIGRVYHNSSIPAPVSVDLFSVALHEIQHALGLSRANPRAIAAVQDSGNINITSEPFLGVSIPTTYPVDGETHINLSSNLGAVNITPVSFGTIQYGQRRCPAAVDVLAVAQVSGYTNIALNPCNSDNPERVELQPPASVPEPSTLAALFVGAVGVLAARRK